MRKITEILRLRLEAKLSYRQIAKSLNVSLGLVGKYVSLAKLAGIEWPLPEGMDEETLEKALSIPQSKQPKHTRPIPDFIVMQKELKRKGMTIQLYWEEYREESPGGYSYTQFCHHYYQWRKRQKRSMRQIHRAGEKLFIDYCGPTVEVVDPTTGEIRNAQVFVGVLGASNYTYAESTWTQSLPDWIGSHVRMFEFLGGVPALLIPDNLRSGVNKACRYEPDINSTYAALVRHYRTAVLPARPYKPKDKAKAEVGVQIVERWILARLRHHTFFSLAQLNIAIAQLLQELNNKPFQKLPGCRRSQFEELDRPELKPLPASPYEYAQWKKARVNIDYHIEVEGHYYSVPNTLVKREVEVRITEKVIECFYRSKRVASHVRSFRKGRHTTVAEHMPTSHQKHMEWTSGRFLNWASDIGPCTVLLVKHLLDKPHPEQRYRACLGLLGLKKRYAKERLEAACQRAIAFGSPSRRSVVSILEKGLDRLGLPEEDQNETNTPIHDNIRGADYYH